METDTLLDILILDDRIISLPYKNYAAADLVSFVETLLNLECCQNFGFTFTDYCERICWLNASKCLYEQHIKRSDDHHVRLSFRLRFPPVEHLSTSIMDQPYLVLQLFLDARRNFYKGVVSCTEENFVNLLSLLLLVEHGGHLGEQEIARYWLPAVTTEMTNWICQRICQWTCGERIVSTYRRWTVSMSRGEALLRFLRIVVKERLYGTQFYDVLDGTDSLWLGLHPSGLFVFPFVDRSTPLKHFPWSTVLNTYCRDNRLSLELVCEQPSKSTSMVKRLALPRSKSSSSVGSSVSGRTAVIAWHLSSERKAKLLLDQVSAHLLHYGQKSERLSQKFRKPSVTAANGRDGVESVVVARLNTILQEECVTSGLGLRLRLDNGSGLHRLVTVTFVPTHVLNTLNVHFHEVYHDMAHNSFGIPLFMTANFPVNQSWSVAWPSLQPQGLREVLLHRRDTLSALLTAKEEELRQLCLDEAAITGSLPTEYTSRVGERTPSVRRCLGTKYNLSPIMDRQQRHTLNHSESEPTWKSVQGDEQRDNDVSPSSTLEVEYELYTQMLHAHRKLATEPGLSKTVLRRRQKEVALTMEKLRQLEEKLHQLRMQASPVTVVGKFRGRFFLGGSSGTSSAENTSSIRSGGEVSVFNSSSSCNHRELASRSAQSRLLGLAESPCPAPTVVSDNVVTSTPQGGGATSSVSEMVSVVSREQDDLWRQAVLSASALRRKADARDEQIH